MGLIHLMQYSLRIGRLANTYLDHQPDSVLQAIEDPARGVGVLGHSHRDPGLR